MPRKVSLDDIDLTLDDVKITSGMVIVLAWSSNIGSGETVIRHGGDSELYCHNGGIEGKEFVGRLFKLFQERLILVN